MTKSSIIKPDIRSMYFNEIADDFTNDGFKTYRAKQVYSWLCKGVVSFDEMTDLSSEMRKYLAEKYSISVAAIERKLVSSIDGTVKYLFSLCDGVLIEAVVMQYKHGKTMCISTQAGCRMGCSFCATGADGFIRNLTAGEMLSQLLAASRDLGEKISNTVLMGMGEPLDNFDNVARFINLATDEKGFCMGSRHITVSTCGIADLIPELCEVNDQITLSVSLHAPNDDIRRKLMPIDKKYPYGVLMDACRRYTERTNKRITFEYTLIEGVNDSDDNARELAKNICGMLCHVNLIPVNAVKGKDQRSSGRERVKRFAAILENAGINATVRRTLGADINASCGQLKREKTEGSDK